MKSLSIANGMCGNAGKVRANFMAWLKLELPLRPHLPILARRLPSFLIMAALVLFAWAHLHLSVSPNSSQTASPHAPSPSQSLLSSLSSNSQGCWMTNYNTNDGWGSQWQQIAATIVIAAKLRLNFAYTPITMLEHLENPHDLEKIREMEVFAGFRSLRSITDIATQVPKRNISYAYQAICNGPIVYAMKNPKKVLDSHPDWWVEKRELLREIYFSSPKPDLSNVFLANRTNVVAFQRRYNKLWDNRCTMLPNEYYISVMDTVRAIHPNSVFHVLSQSNMMQPFPDKKFDAYGNCKDLFSDEQFEDFEAFGNTSIHLDVGVQMAVHMMVTADVLVTSQSSLSYAASVHSAGNIYSIEFWHTGLPGWLSCSYNFDGSGSSCWQIADFRILSVVLPSILASICLCILLKVSRRRSIGSSMKQPTI